MVNVKDKKRKLVDGQDSESEISSNGTSSGPSNESTLSENDEMSYSNQFHYDEYHQMQIDYSPRAKMYM